MLKASAEDELPAILIPKEICENRSYSQHAFAFEKLKVSNKQVFNTSLFIYRVNKVYLHTKIN